MLPLTGLSLLTRQQPLWEINCLEVEDQLTLDDDDGDVREQVRIVWIMGIRFRNSENGNSGGNMIPWLHYLLIGLWEWMHDFIVCDLNSGIFLSLISHSRRRTRTILIELDPKL